ncbi:MAG: substrate-binding domain-containing protein [Chloroflexota bacterium]
MSNTVGVIIAGLDPFYLDLLRGIEITADEQGTLLFIVDASDSEARARTAIRQLTARGVQGIIGVSAGGADQDPSDGSMPPIVYVDQPQRRGNVLLFNFEKAAGDAARHMLGHGHRRIGYITPPLEHPNIRELFDGHRRAMSEAGVAFDPELLVLVESFRLGSGGVGLATLRDRPTPPSAVIVNGGEVTLGVLREAHRRGLRIPDDLAILGYGDINASQLTSPALTMVSLPVYEIGVAAMRALQRMMADPATPSRRVVFDGTLVVRESCGRHS